MSKRLATVLPVLASLACAAADASDAAARADAAVAAASSPAAHDAARTGNVLRLRKSAPAPDHTPTVDSFVQLAKAQGIDRLYRSFGDVPVRANGELALKHYLADEVMPFFADVERLDPRLRVVGATFDDDSSGQIAYAYAVTRTGAIKPFTIAWRVEDGRARLMDVKVGRCVPARHPVFAGGCAR